MITCVLCRAAMLESAKYCGKCGARQVASDRDSPDLAPSSDHLAEQDFVITGLTKPCQCCGHLSRPGAKHCASCGTRLLPARQDGLPHSVSNEVSVSAANITSGDQQASIAAEGDPVDGHPDRSTKSQASGDPATPQEKQTEHRLPWASLMLVAMIGLTVIGTGAGYWLAVRDRDTPLPQSPILLPTIQGNTSSGRPGQAAVVVPEADMRSKGASPPSDAVASGEWLRYELLRYELPRDVTAMLDERFPGWKFVSPISAIRAEHDQNRARPNQYFSYGRDPSLISADFDGNGTTDYAVLISYSNGGQVQAVVAAFLACDKTFVAKGIRVIKRSPEFYKLFVRREGTSGMDRSGEYVYPHDALAIGLWEKHDNSFFVENGVFVSRDSTEPIDAWIFPTKGGADLVCCGAKMGLQPIDCKDPVTW